MLYPSLVILFCIFNSHQLYFLFSGLVWRGDWGHGRWGQKYFVESDETGILMHILLLYIPKFPVFICSNYISRWNLVWTCRKLFCQHLSLNQDHFLISYQTFTIMRISFPSKYNVFWLIFSITICNKICLWTFFWLLNDWTHVAFKQQSS